MAPTGPLVGADNEAVTPLRRHVGPPQQTGRMLRIAVFTATVGIAGAAAATAAADADAAVAAAAADVAAAGLANTSAATGSWTVGLGCGRCCRRQLQGIAFLQVDWERVLACSSAKQQSQAECFGPWHGVSATLSWRDSIGT